MLGRKAGPSGPLPEKGELLLHRTETRRNTGFKPVPANLSARRGKMKEGKGKLVPRSLPIVKKEKKKGKAV